MTTTNVDHLPNEILERVFIFAYPEVDVFALTRFDGSSTSTWTLSHVSRKWRSVVLGSKPLWQRLLLKGGPPYPFAAEFRLRFAISRSSPMRFCVRVTSGYDVAPAAFDCRPSLKIRYVGRKITIFATTFAHANRLDALLEEDASWVSAHLAFCIYPMPFSQLRVLQLSGNDLPDGIMAGNLEAFPMDAPLLRELHLSRFKLNERAQHFLFSTLQIPWSQITHFTADCCQFWEPGPIVNDMWDIQPGEDHLTNLSRFLSHFSGLQQLNLLFDAEEKRWHPDDVCCIREDLKILTIRGASRVVVPILDHIWVPNLQKLQLDVLDGPDTQDWESEDGESEDCVSEDGELDDGEPEDEELDRGEPEDGELEHGESEHHESAVTLERYDSGSNFGSMVGPEVWETEFLECVDMFIDHLNGGEKMTSLVLHGLCDLPVLNWVQQLPNLQTLSVDFMDRELVNYLTWSTDSNRTLPFLELLTWNFDSTKTKMEAQRIVKMVRSRTTLSGNSATTPQACLRRIRLLHQPRDRELVAKSPLVEHLVAVGEIYLEVVDLKDLEWRPLRLYK